LALSSLWWIASASTVTVHDSQMRFCDGLPQMIQTGPRWMSDRFMMPPSILPFFPPRHAGSDPFLALRTWTLVFAAATRTVLFTLSGSGSRY